MVRLSFRDTILAIQATVEPHPPTFGGISIRSRVETRHPQTLAIQANERHFRVVFILRQKWTTGVPTKNFGSPIDTLIELFGKLIVSK